MEQLLIKAAVAAATDQGEFTAVISTANVDRDGDIVEPAAMVNAFRKWAQIGKLMPLAWNHTNEVIGHIDPKSVTVKDNEVITSGKIDQTIPRGEEAWRLIKSGTVSFSYGMLVDNKNTTKLSGGGLRIKELDLFEVSVVPTGPANNDTRVLSWKALKEQVGDLFTDDELEAAVAGALKAVWTAAYVNDLPDSAFLYVEPGDKDSEGKTVPRSNRYFPVKDATGMIDMPHLRNALARIPQSDLPQSVKDRATAMAQRMLDNATKSVDETSNELRARSVDPLRTQALDLAQRVMAKGLQPPAHEPAEPQPEPGMDPVALKDYARSVIVQALSKGNTE